MRSHKNTARSLIASAHRPHVGQVDGGVILWNVIQSGLESKGACHSYSHRKQGLSQFWVAPGFQLKNIHQSFHSATQPKTNPIVCQPRTQGSDCQAATLPTHLDWTQARSKYSQSTARDSELPVTSSMICSETVGVGGAGEDISTKKSSKRQKYPHSHLSYCDLKIHYSVLPCIAQQDKADQCAQITSGHHAICPTTHRPTTINAKSGAKEGSHSMEGHETRNQSL